METIEQYFERPDTPAPRSPVGLLMVRVLEKSPGMSFDGARAEANRLLAQAAGRKVYAIPQVLSPEEKARRIESLRTYKRLPLAA